jgi:hypothetical protein
LLSVFFDPCSVASAYPTKPVSIVLLLCKKIKGKKILHHGTRQAQETQPNAASKSSTYMYMTFPFRFP